MKSTVALLAALVLWPCLHGTAAADVFLLKTGGRVTGELVNRNEVPRKQYVIQVTGGAKVTLDAGQVQKVLHARPDELEYERISPTYPDTVKGQWELATWCRDHKLLQQRETHLRRIIELEPDHAEARRLLGYSRVDGAWTTQDELMAKRGLKRYKGQWRSQQEIDVSETKRKQELVQQDWCQKVKRWRGWFGTDRQDQARHNIRAITDPAAVKGLTIGLRDDPNIAARLLFVETLARIDTNEAALALAVAAIEDSVEEVRLSCLDNLQTKKRPDVVAYFISKLNPKRNQNPVVNLAGAALGRMKDPSAIGPLIDAVVTTHKFRVVNPMGEGGTNASFGKGPNGGGSGMSVGGGPKYVHKDIPNQAVLDALVILTGRNFNFDKQAWKYWYASQKKKPSAIDARRD